MPSVSQGINAPRRPCDIKENLSHQTWPPFYIAPWCGSNAHMPIVGTFDSGKQWHSDQPHKQQTAKYLFMIDVRTEERLSSQSLIMTLELVHYSIWHSLFQFWEVLTTEHPTNTAVLEMHNPTSRHDNLALISVNPVTTLFPASNTSLWELAVHLLPNINYPTLWCGKHCNSLNNFLFK